MICCHCYTIISYSDSNSQCLNIYWQFKSHNISIKLELDACDYYSAAAELCDPYCLSVCHSICLEQDNFRMR